MSDPIAERHAAYTQRIRELEAERDALRALLVRAHPFVKHLALIHAKPAAATLIAAIDAALKEPRT